MLDVKLLSVTQDPAHPDRVDVQMSVQPLFMSAQQIRETAEDEWFIEILERVQQETLSLCDGPFAWQLRSLLETLQEDPCQI